MKLKLIIAAIAIFVILAYLNSATTVSGFATCDLNKYIRVLYNSRPVDVLMETIKDNLDSIDRCAPKKIKSKINTDTANVRALLSTKSVNIESYKNAVQTLKNNLGIKTKMIFTIY